MLKRTVDIFAAVGGLLITAPLVFLLILLVRHDSPGPGIFRQSRIGRHGAVFTCYKLRTMQLDTPNVPSHLAAPGAVTRIGAFLRRSKLDELPQLMNVLWGEMSLVGPRPCLPSQRELIKARDRLGVLDIRPGMTGLAQIEGLDMSDPRRLAARDADYAKRASLALDLQILFRTVFAGAGQGDVSD